MRSSISISQHYMKEDTNVWVTWDPEKLPTEQDELREFLFLDEKIITDLVARGKVSNQCLPISVANFMAVAVNFKLAEYTKLIDHVFFYADEESTLDLGPMFGRVPILSLDSSDENEADYANVSAMFSVGLDAINAGDEQKAEKYWRKALHYSGPDPFDQTLYSHDCLGVLLANQGKTQEALDIWTKGLLKYKSDEFINRLRNVLDTEKDEQILTRARQALENYKFEL